MKRRYPLLALLIVFIVVGLDYYLEHSNSFKSTTAYAPNKTLKFYLPTSTTNQIVHHQYYSLSYNEAHEQAEWVAYYLAPQHIVQNEFKRPFFELDDVVKTKSAHWNNYKNSGYDKGHLCPAGDRRFSKAAYNETFLTSNITPQDHDFNAGLWNQLEQKIRYWAKSSKGLVVFTAGVLSAADNTIGDEEVTVPKQFYKIVLDHATTPPKVIAFLVPHRQENKPLESYVVSVDEIEKRTGIDFLSNLEDEMELQIEQASNYELWQF